MLGNRKTKAGELVTERKGKRQKERSGEGGEKHHWFPRELNEVDEIRTITLDTHFNISRQRYPFTIVYTPMEIIQ